MSVHLVKAPRVSHEQLLGASRSPCDPVLLPDLPDDVALLTQGNYTSNVAQWFIYFLTFWILYSYLVPISLFVT